MPKPYLLVTQIPNDNRSGKGNDQKNSNSGENRGPGSAANTGTKTTDTDTKGGGTSPSPTSDLSYQLGNSIYLLKLVYLPDMSKTMAINIVPGIFGTSSAQPTLQDGWMLTSMQASSDNTKALDDFTSIATAILGSGAKAATGGTTAAAAATNKKTQGPGPATISTELDPVLPPGLYEFRYDEYGHLIGLCTVSTFSHNNKISNTNLIPSDLVGVAVSGRYCPSLNTLISSNVARVKG
jgi:hypothetical protein